MHCALRVCPPKRSPTKNCTPDHQLNVDQYTGPRHGIRHTAAHHITYKLCANATRVSDVVNVYAMPFWPRRGFSSPLVCSVTCRMSRAFSIQSIGRRRRRQDAVHGTLTLRTVHFLSLWGARARMLYKCCLIKYNYIMYM